MLCLLGLEEASWTGRGSGGLGGGGELGVGNDGSSGTKGSEGSLKKQTYTMLNSKMCNQMVVERCLETYCGDLLST